MIRSFFVLFVLSISVFAYSQDTNSVEKESLIITIKPSLGFNVGAGYSLVNNYTALDTFGIYPTTVSIGPGFRLGIFGELKIQQRFTLSYKSELSFSSVSIRQGNETYKLNPVNLDFMLHGKFNFKKRDSKVNPYSYFGPALRVPLNGQSEDYFETKKSWSGDIAIGLDIDLGSFYLSPEIRFSGGLTNIMKEESWEKLRGSYAAFVLNFTGK